MSSDDDGGDSACARCSRLDLDCVWPKVDGYTRIDTRGSTSSDNHPPRISADTPPTSNAMSALVDRYEMTELVDLYFETVHREPGVQAQLMEDYGFLTFLQQPSYYRLLQSGRTPRLLTAMMLACTIRCVRSRTPLTAASLAPSHLRV